MASRGTTARRRRVLGDLPGPARVRGVVDRAHDDADRAAASRIACPVLVLWSSRDDMERLYGDPLSIWRSWAVEPTGGPIDSGHHMAEEAPEQLGDALLAFLTR